MKVLLLLILTSCAFTPVDRTEDLARDRMQKCVEKFVGKYAIKAKIAAEICDGIHRKGE